MFHRTRSRRRRSFEARNSAEFLESRCLLAGDVAAFWQKGSLVIEGDNLDNTVVVTVEDGNVVVKGLNDTYVNNREEPWVALYDTTTLPDDFFANLGRGNDVLLINGITVTDLMRIRGEQGDDQIGLENVEHRGKLKIKTSQGNDVVNLSNTTVSGQTVVRTARGDDLVNVNNSTLSNLKVRTHKGNDDVVLDTVNANGNTSIKTGKHHDSVAVSDSEFGRDFEFDGKRGNDFAQVTGSNVLGTMHLRGFNGDDSILVGNGNTIGRLVARGGNGTDAFELDGSTTVNGRQRTRNFEAEAVSADLAADRLNNPSSGALSRSDVAEAFFASLLGDTVPTSNGIVNITVAENADNTVISLFDTFDDVQDADEALTLTIESNSNTSLFDSVTIDDVTGELTLDYAADTTGSANITVQAEDTDGLTVSETFTVTVGAETLNQFAIQEDAAAGTVLGQLTAQTLSGDLAYERDSFVTDEELHLRPDDHIKGAAASKVTLIEYVDFACPACAAAHPLVEQLEQQFGDELLIVTRHLPLTSIHPNATLAAIAAEAAARQDLFDEFVDQLFDNQDEWDGVTDSAALDTLFDGYATAAGLDVTQFNTDRADTALADRVTRDATDASNLGLTATPTFFLDGAQISTPSTQTEFNEIVQEVITDFNDFEDPFVVNHTTGEVSLASDGTALDATNDPNFDVDFRVTDGTGTTEVIEAGIEVTQA